MMSVTHVCDKEDDESGEEDGGAGDGEGEEEAPGVVHERADHGTDRQAEVEGSITPRLENSFNLFSSPCTMV